MRLKDRQKAYQELKAHVDALVGDRIQETLDRVGPQYFAELFAAALGVDPAKKLVLVGIFNRQLELDGKPETARCEVCGEVLSQGTAQLVPVTYPRLNGRQLLCAVPVCGVECAGELIKR